MRTQMNPDGVVPRGWRGSLKSWLMSHCMPMAVVYPIFRGHMTRRRRRHGDPGPGNWFHTVQDGVWFQVLWASDEFRDPTGLGPGPRCRVFVLGEEVMRLDCFGGRNGHLHINPDCVRLHHLAEARLFYPQGSIEEHIERSVFEVVSNLLGVLAMHPDPKMRRIHVAGEPLRSAAQLMREAMFETLAVNRGKNQPNAESQPAERAGR